MFRPHTRTGATLTEVLVAIFVMAIGLLALLTLFPLGALSMAQAIRDDRTAHSGKNGYAIAQAIDILHDQVTLNVSNSPAGITVASAVGTTPANSTSLFFNPYPDYSQTQPATALSLYLPPDLLNNPIISFIAYDGPSYPVFVDPFGWTNIGTRWVGYNPVTAFPPPPFSGVAGAPGMLPRQPLSSVVTSQAIDRWQTLTDDITFSAGISPQESAAAGTPARGPAGSLPVQRENRYSWAWLMRLPNFKDPSTVDTNVVIYSGRSRTSSGETAYPGVIFGGYFDTTQTPAQVVTTKNFVDVPYPANNHPNVRTGTWILDATMCYTTSVVIGGVPTTVTLPDPHGYFYRVVGWTELGALPSPPYPPGMQGLRLEIQSTFKNPTPTYTGLPTAPAPYGVLVVMENVAEVF
jgi:hypothetical protein